MSIDYRTNAALKYKAGQSMVCQIRIKGHLGIQWTDWFDGLAITLEENGDTLLTGPVVDQSALHGLLKKIRNLGMPLVSINCIEPGQAEAKSFSSDRRFWLFWVLAFLSFPIAGLLANLVGPVTTPVRGLLAGAIAGAALGLIQWLDS